MSDLIDRQAAIDALACLDDYEEEAIEALRKLPSAQPMQKNDSKTLDALDCVSRQAAIDRINKQREHLQPDIYPQDKIGDAAYRICAEFIERMPSAQRKGKWIDVNGDGSLYECDQCHDLSCCVGNYCMECGARMEVE